MDLRPFALRGRPVGLIGATRRDDETVVLYVAEGGAVRPAVPWQHAAIPPGVPADDIYGFALGAWGGESHAIASFKSGHVVQWRLHEAQGTVGMTVARVLTLGSKPEGMVADDAAGWLRIGEEDRGIWRVPLDPASAPELVVPIPSPGLPVDDVEGLAVVGGGAAPPRRLGAGRPPRGAVPPRRRRAPGLRGAGRGRRRRDRRGDGDGPGSTPPQRRCRASRAGCW